MLNSGWRRRASRWKVRGSELDLAMNPAEEAEAEAEDLPMALERRTEETEAGECSASVSDAYSIPE